MPAQLMADIVEHWFAYLWTFQGGQHLISCASTTMPMARPDSCFKAYDIRIVFVSITCIRIHVAYKSSNSFFPVQQ